MQLPYSLIVRNLRMASGLVLFTYTIGVASGPTFVAGLRRRGVSTIAVTVALVGTLAAFTAAVAAVFDLSPADRAGMFAGATTNTPALQAAADSVAEGDPVIAYSLTYPAAVAALGSSSSSMATNKPTSGHSTIDQPAVTARTGVVTIAAVASHRSGVRA